MEGEGETSEIVSRLCSLLALFLALLSAVGIRQEQKTQVCAHTWLLRGTLGHVHALMGTLLPGDVQAWLGTEHSWAPPASQPALTTAGQQKGQQQPAVG